ncbi:MAG TPA: T9SS type A sorting domain-containing protein [Flavipsychrobacter sp.]|nr:T9SS type A sorting domain-containing protein [Flavipsychrobacter sp.]
MKKTLHYLLFVISFCSLHFNAYAQSIFHGYEVMDTTVFNFNKIDSLNHYITSGGYYYYPVTFIVDTTGMNLWEIGATVKPFFADSSPIKAIMTDTLHNYPINANSSFVLKLSPAGDNNIISFWHKYQTTAGHDGGIVEFSADNGVTWQNILGDCNGDSMFSTPTILTNNFYGKNDTLLSGEAAFSGTSGGWQLSQFQFFNFIPVRLSGSSSCINDSEMLIRFRFKSDSIPDSLDGWIISKIELELDAYSGVPTISKPQSLKVFPNPSIDGIFHFPALDNEGKYSMEIFNAVGDKIYTGNYLRDVNLSNNARGIYFYKVGNGTQYYRGTISDE